MQPMLPRGVPLALGAVACAGIVACGSGTLSRRQATAALAAEVSGPAGSIRVFRTRCVERNFGDYPLNFAEDNQTADHYRSLEDAGLATTFFGQPTPDECGTPYLESKQLIGISLTATGAAEDWPEHQERGGGWDIVLAHRELVEVTDILMEPDRAIVRAEFTWRLVPTAGGAALGRASSALRGHSTFQRDDDGWRLTRIDYSPPG